MSKAAKRPDRPDEALARDLLAPPVPGCAPIEKLLRWAQFFSSGKPTRAHREVHHLGGREAEEFWHEQWRQAFLCERTDVVEPPLQIVV